MRNLRLSLSLSRMEMSQKDTAKSLSHHVMASSYIPSFIQALAPDKNDRTQP